MRVLYLTKQTPRVNWKWIDRVAPLFDLSGFTEVPAPMSIPAKRKTSHNLKLKNPYWS